MIVFKINRLRRSSLIRLTNRERAPHKNNKTTKDFIEIIKICQIFSEETQENSNLKY